ncbi:MAG: ribosome silencing factor [Alphaproteobacteria bacterium]|nr:ribosome silencing factor [Alphaproteobacteria bacterium]MBT5799142.1 ribosome silencing factor [Alphaproteobacteria bacterium]
MKNKKEQLTPDQLNKLVLQSLDDDKGEEILSIPLGTTSSIADYIVIASGGSSRKVLAMAQNLEIKLKKAGVTILGREGAAQADWVLLDACDVIVHLFKPEVREFYGLERMWAPSGSEETIQVTAEQ